MTDYSSNSTTLVIGTRGSELAMWQATHVRELLKEANPDCQIQIRKIETAGDRRSGSGIPSTDTGIFTSAIEERLLAGEVDVAVHSMKDLPTDMPEGLMVAAVPHRGEPADVLVTDDARPLCQLPRRATVLTGSPRRQAQLRAFRQDLDVRGVAGNVPTRLRKLKSSDAAALVLASAGLTRLGLAAGKMYRLDPADFIPSPGQGAMAVQVREDHRAAVDACAGIDHKPSRLTVTAERAMLSELGAGCSVPAGGYARLDSRGAGLKVIGMVGAPAGSPLVKETVTDEITDCNEADELGRELAERLRERGADDILREFRSKREED